MLAGVPKWAGVHSAGLSGAVLPAWNRSPSAGVYFGGVGRVSSSLGGCVYACGYVPFSVLRSRFALRIATCSAQLAFPAFTRVPRWRSLGVAAFLCNGGAVHLPPARLDADAVGGPSLSLIFLPLWGVVRTGDVCRIACQGTCRRREERGHGEGRCPMPLATAPEVSPIPTRGLALPRIRVVRL